MLSGHTERTEGRYLAVVFCFTLQKKKLRSAMLKMEMTPEHVERPYST